MKITDVKEYDTIEFYKKIYTFDQPLDLDTIIATLKSYENEQTKMLICHCSSFSDSGSVLTCAYNDINELSDIRDLPSPYVRLSASFGDRQTSKYLFSIITNTNSDCIVYMINKERL